MKEKEAEVQRTVAEARKKKLFHQSKFKRGSATKLCT